MFRRVLIANRGEIAVRIMRTCREMGIETVAVYSESDRTALHTTYATRAHEIGPAPSRESYLSIPRILAAAKASGADAIHPGYGFLSERAAFARACAETGIAFIGPSPEAIEIMGDKTRARQRMLDAGVPIVPGTREPLASEGEAEREARRIGYPIMLKAAAGGGGRGMRLVRSASELALSFASASREALAAFGDGSVYLERFIERPRHIEIQVFGDQHGNLVHLNERECSVQRRHQKVIEEAPSSFVDAGLRARMGEVAITAARSVDYVGAGTVEFLVDENREFYFLEMNTRLQVEHPVTELTTGYDLVREQLRVACGERLAVAPCAPQGHAIEARVYAENPSMGFQPSPGKIAALRNAGGLGVRVDSGVYAGYVVPPHYDALLSKVIAHGHDRITAATRLDRALSEYVVSGIDTNIRFLRQILRHPAFLQGDTDTGFIERCVSSEPPPSPHNALIATIAACIRQHEYARERSARIVETAPTEERGSAWRDVGRRGWAQGNDF